MLGYKYDDIQRMINAVHDAKLFYLRHPSDLMDKSQLRADLEETVSFLYGVLEEGHVQ
jgi:hypothetical protein